MNINPNKIKPEQLARLLSADRLGRSTVQVLGTLKELHDRGVVVRS